MTIELGKYGIWQRSSDATPEGTSKVEELGFGALWAGGSPDGGLHEIEALLEGSDAIPVATGIVNMWKAEAGTVADSYHRINGKHPGRFLLGVGIGHPEATSEYQSPYEVMVRYLSDLARADVPKEHLVLAALGPKALRLSGERTAGTHPYLTTPRHTRLAREILGEGSLVAPEQTVVVVEDPDEAHRLARGFVARYLRLVNYRNNLLREGWTEEDLDDGGSDRLVAELVLTGTIDEIAQGIRAHLDAGADHVCIQPLDSDPAAAYEALAEALL